jgi:hypothetical protein
MEITFLFAIFDFLNFDAHAVLLLETFGSFQ